MAVTSQTTSENIKSAIDTLAVGATSGAYDTKYQVMRPHYFDSDLYMILSDFDAAIYGMGDGLPPTNLAQNIGDAVRAWSLEEIKAWVAGCALFTPIFTFEAGTPSGRKCTIEIDTGSWEGTDLLGRDDEACGLAFIELLNDANYTDYCTLD